MNQRNILNLGGWPGINSCSLLQLILTLHINKNLLLAGVKAACPYSIQQYTAITAAPLPCIRTDLRTYIQYIVGKTAKPLSVEGENKEVRGYSKKDLRRQPRSQRTNFQFSMPNLTYQNNFLQNPYFNCQSEVWFYMNSPFKCPAQISSKQLFRLQLSFQCSSLVYLLKFN